MKSVFKKYYVLICVAALCFGICLCQSGCAERQEGRSGSSYNGKSVNDVLSEQINSGSEQSNAQPGPAFTGTGPVSEYSGKIDIDLTKMNATMVYAEVYNMMTSPDEYLGKTVRMSGVFSYGEGDGRYYFACIIADATACCSQGIEYLLKTPRKFPEEYPSVGEAITVTGVFDTYYEGSYRYCQLIDAVYG